MSWTSDLRKLRARPWLDRWLLLEAVIWLGLTHAAIVLLPFRRVAALLGLAQGKSPIALEPARVNRAERIGWAMRVAAARTPWNSTCLCQALAGVVLLRQWGIPGTLYLGIAKDENTTETMTVPAWVAQSWAAHAWLRCGENILTGASGHEQFTVLATFAVV